MRNRVFVRPARAHEGQLYFDWMAENKANDFDPEVAKFPSSVTWVAYDHEGPLAFQTAQRPILLDSFAARPGATKEQITVALRELTQNAVTNAHVQGAGELYFLGSDAGTNDLAVNQIFERTNYIVYRLKLKDTENADKH